MREIWVSIAIVVTVFVAYLWLEMNHVQVMAEIRFKRDKAHQELVVEKLREERLLLEARIRELEMTGSFITKEGVVYDQSIDPVN